MKPKLKTNTRRLMLRRKMWRVRAMSEAVRLATWDAGRPGRREAESAVNSSLSKVKSWFREPRASKVVMAIQRRAVEAFRQKDLGPTQ
jgi:hypothetical protein